VSSSCRRQPSVVPVPKKSSAEPHPVSLLNRRSSPDGGRRVVLFGFNDYTVERSTTSYTFLSYRRRFFHRQLPPLIRFARIRSADFYREAFTRVHRPRRPRKRAKSKFPLLSVRPGRRVSNGPSHPRHTHTHAHARTYFRRTKCFVGLPSPRQFRQVFGTDLGNENVSIPPFVHKPFLSNPSAVERTPPKGNP